MHVSSSPAASAPAAVSPFDAADYAALEYGIQARLGIRLSDYRREQMHRRLRTLAQAHGQASFTTLLQAMTSKPVLLQEFLATMTINVTEILRNPERFEELRAAILPDLLAHPRGKPFSAWSAGCSYGAEAFTLAMLLHEIQPFGMHRIVGTDVDLTVLAKAKTACFSVQDMNNLSPERRQTHFQDMGPGRSDLGPLTPRFHPLPHLCGKVRFDCHDLLADPYPVSEYDLILCRNVLIYFTEEAKQRIYQGFLQALRPGGVLFIGGTERLSDHRQAGFELVRPFFYRKPSA